MISRQEAEQIASSVLGRSPTDNARPWRLREFDDGWLIQEERRSEEELIGAAVRVIEQPTGRVMRFPSSVPPNRIMRNYAAVRARGRVEEEPLQLS
jgi:hypothetical protein